MVQTYVEYKRQEIFVILRQYTRATKSVISLKILLYKEQVIQMNLPKLRP